jgi:hypothetical protein
MAKTGRHYVVNGVKHALHVVEGGVKHVAAHDDCCCEEDIISDCESCCVSDNYGSLDKCPKYMSVELEFPDYPEYDGLFVCEYGSGGWTWNVTYTGSCLCFQQRMCTVRLKVIDTSNCYFQVLWSFQSCPCTTNTWTGCVSTSGFLNLRYSCPGAGADSSAGGCEGDTMYRCSVDDPTPIVTWFPCDEFGDPL